MKKTKKCKHCGASFGDTYKCDTCSKDLIENYTGIPITVYFGFGSQLDGEEYHFCNEGHAIKFLADELRKNNPETRFELGKQKKLTKEN
jgi:YHS domain-containing protein